MPPRYWVDSCCFMQASKDYYTFEMFPQVWTFLKDRAEDGIIGSPEICLTDEIIGDPKKPDPLKDWARPLNGILFLPATEPVQRDFARVVNAVERTPRYQQAHISPFLAKADCWVIAYAITHGGKIVTFETPAPQSSKPKIPDVAAPFGVATINLFQMLGELGFRAG